MFFRFQFLFRWVFCVLLKARNFFFVCVVFGRTEVTFKENYYLLQRYIKKIRKNLTVKRNRSKEKYANQIKEENTNQNGFFRPAFKWEWLFKFKFQCYINKMKYKRWIRFVFISTKTQQIGSHFRQDVKTDGENLMSWLKNAPQLEW